MKFSVRDMLWMMVVVGLTVGWWTDHRHQAQTKLKFTVVERMLQHMLNQYYADTGRYMEVGEDSLGLDYHPTNVQTATGR
ncbi:MAG TPA: hypothetical protein VFV87_07105 [Pirellulaceae bacterium]|nr:hypothetical protein [Pirellulaceae bacterium]